MTVYTSSNVELTTSVILDHKALAAVLRLMSRERIPGISLNPYTMSWHARIKRSGVLYQKTFPFPAKAEAIAWLVCLRAELQLKGLGQDGRKRRVEAAA
ncbi:hypothetical protein D3C85_900000 [compost metagenome]